MHDVRVNSDGIIEWDSEKPRLHRMLAEYFNNRKEGPKPNNTNEHEDAWYACPSPPTHMHTYAITNDAETGLTTFLQRITRAAQMRSLSREARSVRGYHCHRPEYRPACKVAFRLWVDALRQTKLQLDQRRLRREAAEAQKQACLRSLALAPSACLSSSVDIFSVLCTSLAHLRLRLLAGHGTSRGNRGFAGV